MESMLRRLRLIKVDSRETDARRRLQKELFEFNECGDRDFPARPSCLAYDSHLSLVALGTRTGAIRIYGRPGVYFSGQHKAEIEVKKLSFLPDQARIVTLCGDNSLNLWEYNTESHKLELVRSCSVEDSKVITSWDLSSNHEQLVLGTESGSILFFDIKAFSLTDRVLHQDVLTKNAPEDFKVSPGAIEAVLYHPTDSNKILIGYNRGLIVSWNLSEDNAESTCNSSQQLESLAFAKNGKEFVSAHADGSYITWSTEDITKPKDHPSTPYGPFPCKAITAIESHLGKSEPWTVFVGGMPRASHGDKNTVSVIHGSKHVVFDFTSRVLDFTVLAAATGAEEASDAVNEPHTLLVLTEEQLVAVDLSVEGWPQHRLPYLSSTAAISDVTTIQHIDGLSQAALNNIVNAGHRQFNSFSTNEWPITGGELKEVSDKRATSILLTGHLDGSVRFWDVSLSGGLYLLYTLHTSDLFAVDTLNAQPTGEPSEDEWPPLRKVGGKQFTLDDQHLSITKIVFCTATDTLLLGGASGQISVFNLTGADSERKVEKHIMSMCETTICYGTEALELKPEPVMTSPGFQPVCVVQMHPPAACKHLAYHSSGKLVAAASDQGVGVFDLVGLKTVCTKPVTASSELKMSRSRSFQRTLRDSFRQLRRHRSESDQKAEAKATTETQQPTEVSKEPAESTEKPAETVEVPENEKAETETENKEEKKVESEEKTDEKIEKIPTEEDVKKDVENVEEKPEEKKTDAEIITTSEEAPKTEEKKEEIELSPPKSPTKAKSATLGRDHAAPTPVVMEAVNSISFADTFIAHGQPQGTTLWIGTVAGHVLIYQLIFPEAEKRSETDVKCMIAKEIHLKHGAPVIATFVVDRSSHLVTDAVKLEPESPGAHAGHRVVVCTEQQVKIFSLPSLKAHNKYKLHGEGDTHFVDAKYCTFISKSDDAYSEPDLVCVTNHGKIHVLSVPQLRLQLQPNAGFASGASVAIPTGVTQRGRVVYKLSASPELREYSVAAHPTAPVCVVQLKDGMRPEPEPVAEAVPEPVAEAAPEAVAEAAIADEPAKDPEAKTDAPVDEAQPTDKGDGKPADESIVSVNDSLVAADITTDSIKVHVKEESSSSMIVAENELSSQKVVETMTHSVKTVSGVTEELKTTTIESVSKIEGMMSSCTMTSSTSSSSKVEESTALTSTTTTTAAAVEG